MVNQQSFGRRIRPQPPRTQLEIESVKPSTKAWSSEVPAQQELPRQENAGSQSVEQELQEWKRARRRNFKLPWFQLWLMASLSFGIASFVLPDSVNDQVDWLLYALMAASAYAGFSRRRQEKRARSEPAAGITRDLTDL